MANKEIKKVDNKAKKPSNKKKKFDLIGGIKKIGHFFKEVASELKKVTWPTKKTMAIYTVAVLVFVGIVMAVVFVLDAGLAQVIRLTLE